MNKHTATLTAIAAVASLAPVIATPATAQAHLPAARVTAANLPTTSEIKFYTDSKATTVQTRKGNVDGHVSLCQTKNWTAFAPNAVYNRVYRITSTLDGTNMGTARASVASFASHKAAVNAAAAMARSFACTRNAHAMRGMDQQYTQVQQRTITISGTPVRLAYVYLYPNNGGAVLEQDTAVLVTGTHTELISLTDNNQNPESYLITNTAKAALPTLAK